MYEFAFEKEYFVVHKKMEGALYPNNLCLVPKGIDRDECGYLAEARGPKNRCPIHAAYGLLAEEDILISKALDLGFDLLCCRPYTKLPKSLARAAMREFGKGTYPHERGNLYGKDFQPNDSWQRAGLHVHFSNNKIVKMFTPPSPHNPLGGYHEESIPAGIMDMPRIIRELDKRFAPEIKASKRLPGFYELKPYGFEYRSLPNSISVVEVAKFIKGMM